MLPMLPLSAVISLSLLFQMLLLALCINVSTHSSMLKSPISTFLHTYRLSMSSPGFNALFTVIICSFKYCSWLFVFMRLCSLLSWRVLPIFTFLYTYNLSMSSLGFNALFIVIIFPFLGVGLCLSSSSVYFKNSPKYASRRIDQLLDGISTAGFYFENFSRSSDVPFSFFFFFFSLFEVLLYKRRFFVVIHSCILVSCLSYKASLSKMVVNIVEQNPYMPSWPGVLQFSIFLSFSLNEFWFMFASKHSISFSCYLSI